MSILYTEQLLLVSFGWIFGSHYINNTHLRYVQAVTIKALSLNPNTIISHMKIVIHDIHIMCKGMGDKMMDQTKIWTPVWSVVISPLLLHLQNENSIHVHVFWFTVIFNFVACIYWYRDSNCWLKKKKQYNDSPDERF